jgi:uncharacterized membrane protein
MKDMKKSMIVAASAFAAGAFTLSVAAQTTPPTSASPSFGQNKTDCKGINACKGQGACKSATNACKGQNACKDQGWVKGVSTLACQAQGGSNPP